MAKRLSRLLGKSVTLAKDVTGPEVRKTVEAMKPGDIVMLENLAFPKNMRRVPEYAGTHHETLIGTGYPRRLGREQLSIPARIMAIADIFEALTATDRPYKRGKPLSEAIRILAQFRDRGHIDSDLFDLFLLSGTYQRYAERFLRPEQIDAVDPLHYILQPAPSL